MFLHLLFDKRLEKGVRVEVGCNLQVASCGLVAAVRAAAIRADEAGKD